MSNPKIEAHERSKAWQTFLANCPYPNKKHWTHERNNRSTKDFNKFLCWDTRSDEYIEHRYHMFLGPHGAAIVKAWYIKEGNT